MRYSNDVVSVVLGLMVLIVIMAIIVCGDTSAPRCEVERYNCKKALRTGWDRGPTLRLDEHCDERCKEPSR